MVNDGCAWFLEIHLLRNFRVNRAILGGFWRPWEAGQLAFFAFHGENVDFHDFHDFHQDRASILQNDV